MELPKSSPEELTGPKYPCTVIQRTTAHWFLPNDSISGYGLGLLYFNRMAGFLDHKPGETFLLGALATLLSPLRLGISKLVECYLKWRLPLKKYGLVPKYRFYENVYSCQIGMIPDNFVNRLEDGSIVIKSSSGFGFCRQGLIIDGETKPLETDIVIFATGFKGDHKLKNIFESPVFQNYIMGSPTSTLPLYRQIVHPRIPQLGIIGYSESLSNLTTSEIRCQWLTQFLGGRMELPSITEMEKDIKIWDEYIKKYNGKYFRRSSIAAAYICYNDQLCRDMGRKPRRKKGIFAELFEPYAAQDYVGLTDEMPVCLSCPEIPLGFLMIYTLYSFPPFFFSTLNTSTTSLVKATSAVAFEPGLTWLLREWFSTSEIGPEAVIAILGIITAINEHIIDTAPNERHAGSAGPSSFPYGLCIPALKDLETLVEVVAEQYYGG
ncbi:Peroxisome membrane protein, Pex16 [Corchorus capsularis]|uniref:Flavin-containing monooxygenase n=1 Tax=Corchorus capsularis TaxID=210143 RepID=A0A1R3IZN5_COCAP|nr:Peroxisome membrane protein, Pex16 [Corchorus capsularis]